MELNRSGKWREAEKIGQDMLAKGKTFSHSEICETYFHVIYAKTRLNKKTEAIKLMTEYEEYSVRESIDPQLLWLNREMAKLKNELGMLSEVQHLLVTAMEENGKGNYLLARDLAETVLTLKEAEDHQKAAAHFIAAVCSIRLKDAEGAEAHLAGFDALKSVLPRDHQAILEETFAREGLEKLKNN